MGDYHCSEEALIKDFEQTHATFRMMADIRFKLLALVPTLSAAGIVLLSKGIEQAGAISPYTEFVVGILGFLVTLGVTFYDERNSQLWNVTAARLARLEQLLRLPSRRARSALGGLISEKPGRDLRFFGLWGIWYDRGLALIYGVVLGAWFFPIVHAGLHMMKTQSVAGLSNDSFAAVVAALAAVAFVCELHRLDDLSKRSALPDLETEPFVDQAPPKDLVR